MVSKSAILLAILAVAFFALSGCVNPPVCGNGVCELGENSANCPQDCGTAWCGNGKCEFGENRDNCPEDCLVSGCVESDYYEGDLIGDLEGRDNYAGQTLTVKLVSIVQQLPSAGYMVKFELYAQSGQMIDTEIAGTGTDMRDIFFDSAGYPALDTTVRVKSIVVNETASKGFVTIEVCPAEQPTAVCGNGICEETENSLNCPEDCQAPECGNSICEIGESQQNCPDDCPAPSCTSEIYYEGEVAQGLEGRGAYSRQWLSVKTAAVVVQGGSGDMAARFELFDAEGRIADTQTVGPGNNLKDVFVDANSGDYVLKTHAFVESIFIEPLAQRGFVTLEICRPVIVCGNGECEIDETYDNCPEDCMPPTCSGDSAAYCDSFDGMMEVVGSKCTNAACLTYQKWCSGADIDRSGSVGSLDYILLKGNFGHIGCDYPNDWCSRTDITQDGNVSASDLQQLTSRLGSKNCDLPEKMFIDCYSTADCHAVLTENECLAVLGCVWG